MKTISKSFIFSSGLAIFSMLFGAGNVIYPLVAGTFSKDKYIFTSFGFLLSSVIFGFIGTISIMLYEGDFFKFFNKLGKGIGFFLTIFIMSLIGPFGALPRIICVAFGNIKTIFPNMQLIYFNSIACLLIFIFAFKKKKILEILGYVLTPLLLISLLSIIVIGFFKTSAMPVSDLKYTKAITYGFVQGNQTMDLFGSLCFASMVYNIFKSKISLEKDNKKLLSIAIKASSIGLLLLALVYVAFIKLSAFYGPYLNDSSGSEILANLSVLILGKKAAYISSSIVVLACLTTAIAITNVFSELIHDKILNKKIKYNYCLIGTIMITFLLSILNFDGIVKILTPILEIIYPSLIVLSIVNLLHKLYGFKMIKTPVIITFVLSIGYRLFF